MRSIWKWTLSSGAGEQEILMPALAEILALQVQDGQPHLWTLADASSGLQQRRKFVTYGTGQIIPEGTILGAHIGTYQLYDGALVFHVFEVPV